MELFDAYKLEREKTQGPMSMHEDFSLSGRYVPMCADFVAFQTAIRND